MVDAKAEADAIFRAKLGLSPAERLQYGRGEVAEPAAASVEEVMQQRETGLPLAYCTGRAEFCGHSFVVTPDVLIPRPETEILVARGAEWLEDQLLRRFNRDKVLADGHPILLDLGCGSGAIGISLALQFPTLRVVLADVSEPALRVAEENAIRLGVIERCQFRSGDWFAWARRRERFELILCNPPYVTRRDDPRLAASVREHEPSIALFLDEEPEEFFFRLARKAVSHLGSGGLFAVEVGYDTAWPARCGFDKVHSLQRGKGVHDFSGIERVIWGIRK